jgi:hypothetical protein
MAIFSRIANIFRRTKVDREIDDELQAHIALRIDDNLAAGMSPTDARRDALVRFGNRTTTKERVTAADATLTLESLVRNLRYAFRQLRRSPGLRSPASSAWQPIRSRSICANWASGSHWVRGECRSCVPHSAVR